MSSRASPGQHLHMMSALGDLWAKVTSADVGSANHHGLVGEWTAKQMITTGYNNAGNYHNENSSSRAAQIKQRMQKLDRCGAAIFVVIHRNFLVGTANTADRSSIH